MRFLTAARERLYLNVTNKFPYDCCHVLNHVAFHGFVYTKDKTFACVCCEFTTRSWGRNTRRACVSPADLSVLSQHADHHLLLGEARIPFEEFATAALGPDLLGSLRDFYKWDQAAFVSSSLKKLAECGAIRERLFADHPEAVAALHHSEPIENCVSRGLWYNPVRRTIECAFCPYANNVLGAPHSTYHNDLTQCPRLIDCRSGDNADVAQESNEGQQAQRVDELETALAVASNTFAAGAGAVVGATRFNGAMGALEYATLGMPALGGSLLAPAATLPLALPQPPGSLSAAPEMRDAAIGLAGLVHALETEGYSRAYLLQLLAKRQAEKLETLEDFKEFEKKVADQNYLTLAPIDRCCCICLIRTICATADPCGHMNYCATCLKKLRRCAICKRHITRKLRVYSPYS